jgi:hypothetical protein
LDTDAPDAGVSHAPQNCCAGVTVHVGWHDDRNGEWDTYAATADFTPLPVEAR